MSAGPAGKLYTPDLLSLATQLARFPLSDEFSFWAQERSRTCGSTIELGVAHDRLGLVSGVGLKVSACAIGQASAAIMAMHLVGTKADQAITMEPAIAAWLVGEGTLPDWPGFDALAPALPHKGRHDALILPWRALSRALSNPPLSKAPESS